MKSFISPWLLPSFWGSSAGCTAMYNDRNSVAGGSCWCGTDCQKGLWEGFSGTTHLREVLIPEWANLIGPWYAIALLDEQWGWVLYSQLVKVILLFPLDFMSPVFHWQTPVVIWLNFTPNSLLSECLFSLSQTFC